MGEKFIVPFGKYLEVNTTYILCSFIAVSIFTILCIGPVMGIFFWLGYSTFIVVWITASCGIAAVIVSLLGVSVSHQIQHNAISRMTNNIRPKDLCLAQSRKFYLKTKKQHAYEILKASLTALPYDDTFQDDVRSGQIRVKRRGSWYTGLGSNIDIAFNPERKSILVFAYSKPTLPIGFHDRGQNFRNLDLIMKYLDKNHKSIFKPCGFTVVPDRMGPEYLRPKGKPVKIMCPNCGNVIEVTDVQRPITVDCSFCGKTLKLVD